MSKIIDISTCIPLESDKFFFDANIWMYLYCPLGGYRREIIKKYDGFFKKAIQAKSSIFISSLVLSEIFNAWIKLDFNIFRNRNPTKDINYKKDYRCKEDYKDSVSKIKTEVTKILNITKRIDDRFKDIPVVALFKETGTFDFNDNYYFAMAKLENFKIVTNDSDFVSSTENLVPILTANNKMLRNI